MKQFSNDDVNMSAILHSPTLTYMQTSHSAFSRLTEEVYGVI